MPLFDIPASVAFGVVGLVLVHVAALSFWVMQAMKKPKMGNTAALETSKNK